MDGRGESVDTLPKTSRDQVPPHGNLPPSDPAGAAGFGEAIRDGLRVFPENTAPQFARDFLFPVIVTGLDAVENLLVVHDIRFREDDGAMIHPVGQQIAHPEAGVVIHLAGVFPQISKGWQAGGGRKVTGHRIATDLMQPQLIGYKRHPFLRDWWRYVDIETPAPQ